MTDSIHVTPEEMVEVLDKPGCIYKHPHPDYECRNQDDMRDASESGQPPEARDE